MKAFEWTNPTNVNQAVKMLAASPGNIGNIELNGAFELSFLLKLGCDKGLGDALWQMGEEDIAGRRAQ